MRADSISDEHLHAIEEAGEYFGGKLSSADMFRLVVSQINQVVPFDTCALIMLEPDHSVMRVEMARGQKAEKFRANVAVKAGGLAERCISTGEAQFEQGSLESGGAFSAEALEGLRSSAAVPLKNDGAAFGVLQFFAESPTALNADATIKLDAVAERVGPMIMSSLSYERSLSSALTDSVTDLPNERAFRLVLENQIAESQRKRGDRPLTMVAIDIKNFDEINSRFGHSSGDRMLGLIAQVIKGQLRQMDFVARSKSDEFLAIFPTADENVAFEIVERINAALLASRFFVTENDPIVPELYFGAAAFGKHGETADQLIRSARLNKQQAKAKAPANVVWFPEQAAG
jgi:diguanylate cyclase (GGDEF)-like protein